MSGAELLQYLNVLLLPIGVYVVVLERRMAKLELLTELAKSDYQRLAGQILAAHIRLDKLLAPAASSGL